MELTILMVSGCPHVPVLEEHLAQVLAGRSGVSVVRRVIIDEEQAARSGMHGSPTLLIDGIDPFTDPTTPPSLSCRTYRQGDDSRTAPVPSVAALRRALQTPGPPENS